MGLGYGEKVHIPAFQRHPKFRVTAVCGRSAKKAERLRKKYDIARSYHDWRGLIRDKDVQCVSIATPPDVQPKIAIAALKQKKAVFCEKPLAMDAREARRMWRAARSNQMPHAVDFEFPELPEWRKAKRFIDNGFIGKLRRIRVLWGIKASRSSAKKSWKSSASRGGGVLHYYLSHTFHYLEWFAGPIREIFFASGPSARLAARFKNGTEARVLVTNGAGAPQEHRLDFYGDKGALVLEGTEFSKKKFSLRAVSNLTGKSVALLKESAPNFDGGIESMVRIADRLAAWILKGRPCVPNFEEGVRVQALIEAALRSNRRHRWIKIK